MQLARNARTTANNKHLTCICVHCSFKTENSTYLETIVWPFDKNFRGDRWIADILIASRWCWRRHQRCHWYWLFHWTSWYGLFFSHWSFHVYFLSVFLFFYIVVILSYRNCSFLKTKKSKTRINFSSLFDVKDDFMHVWVNLVSLEMFQFRNERFFTLLLLLF